MTMIDQRPAEVDNRRQAGHWEGDLIVGTNCRSAIATLVERTSRFVVMVPLPDGHKAPAVQTAIVAALAALPAGAVRTLTWDQGTELAQHRQIAAASGISIYFCEPNSPWQRGTNENTNGLFCRKQLRGLLRSHVLKAAYASAEAQRPGSRPMSASVASAISVVGSGSCPLIGGIGHARSGISPSART